MYIKIEENPHKCGMCHKENIEVKPLYTTFKMDDGNYCGEFLHVYLCEECFNKLSSLKSGKVEIQSVDGVMYSVTINRMEEIK